MLSNELWQNNQDLARAALEHRYAIPSPAIAATYRHALEVDRDFLDSIWEFSRSPSV